MHLLQLLLVRPLQSFVLYPHFDNSPFIFVVLPSSLLLTLFVSLNQLLGLYQLLGESRVLFLLLLNGFLQVLPLARPFFDLLQRRIRDIPCCPK